MTVNLHVYLTGSRVIGKYNSGCVYVCASRECKRGRKTHSQVGGSSEWLPCHGDRKKKKGQMSTGLHLLLSWLWVQADQQSCVPRTLTLWVMRLCLYPQPVSRYKTEFDTQFEEHLPSCLICMTLTLGSIPSTRGWGWEVEGWELGGGSSFLKLPSSSILSQQQKCN